MTIKESTEKKKRITVTKKEKNKLARQEQPDIKSDMNKECLQKVRNCRNEKYSC